MKFEYIDKNLIMILQNPNDVLYLRPFDIENKIALFAVMREKPGVYKKVQITKEQSKLSFPFEPIYCFYDGPGYIYLNNFLIFNNYTALNITNLEGFMYKKDPEKRRYFNALIFATFNDGSAAFVVREKEKKFQKQGGIKYYLSLLEQYKKYEPGFDNYEILENYMKDDSDTIVIPRLLQDKNVEQPKVKKLINDI